MNTPGVWVGVAAGRCERGELQRYDNRASHHAADIPQERGHYRGQLPNRWKRLRLRLRRA